MAFQHGVRVSEQPTSLIAPVLGTAGLQVVFGTAPVNLAEDPYNVTNTPVIAYSWSEAVKKLGYSADYAKYTLCQSMYASFQLIGVAPVVFVNVLDPKKHKKKIDPATVQVEDMEALVPVTGLLLDTVKISVPAGDGGGDPTALANGADYLLSFDDDGQVLITLTTAGAGAAATTLTVEGTAIDPDAVDENDVIGVSATGGEKGFEVLRQVYPKLGSYDRACVHGFIDANTGDIYQTLPWDRRVWHCASGKNGSGNNTHIGVEMCEPATIKYTGGASFTCSDRAAALAAAERTYKAAVELFAHLCQQYGLDPLKDGVILSHREGHARGIASNHGDPEHLWKGLGMSYTMDTFRAAVKAQMGGTAPAPATPAPPPEKPATGVPYLVRVKITDLHIRSGPGTNYASKGFIAPGAYTIVEESTGQGAALWGKLKSGKGWIALGYTEKV